MRTYTFGEQVSFSLGVIIADTLAEEYQGGLASERRALSYRQLTHSLGTPLLKDPSKMLQFYRAIKFSRGKPKSRHESGFQADSGQQKFRSSLALIYRGSLPAAALSRAETEASRPLIRGRAGSRETQTPGRGLGCDSPLFFAQVLCDRGLQQVLNVGFVHVVRCHDDDSGVDSLGRFLLWVSNVVDDRLYA